VSRRPAVIVAAALAAALVAALATVPLAHADGDPASDWLLTEQTFVPPDDNVPAAYAAQLRATVADAAARGYRIRVALLGNQYDMGSVYSLWKQPKEYALFLGKELAFVYPGRLLVVFPNGLATSVGGRAAPASQQAVVARIAPPGLRPAALASAATKAVVKLAADKGVVITAAPLGGGKAGGGGSSGGGSRVTIAAAALLVAALAGVLVLWSRRRRRVSA